MFGLLFIKYCYGFVVYAFQCKPAYNLASSTFVRIYVLFSIDQVIRAVTSVILRWVMLPHPLLKLILCSSSYSFIFFSVYEIAGVEIICVYGAVVFLQDIRKHKIHVSNDSQERVKQNIENGKSHRSNLTSPCPVQHTKQWCATWASK